MPRRSPDILTTPIDWQNKKILGYHATSTYALAVLEKTGSLPPTPYGAEQELGGNKGYLHFYPTTHYIRNPDIDLSTYTYNGNYMMRRYGDLNSRIHHVISELKLDYSDEPVMGAVSALMHRPTDDPEVMRELEEARVLALSILKPKIQSLDQLTSAINSSHEQMTVVLGLSSRIQDEYEIDDDPYDSLAKRIYVPDGLKMRFISNLRAL